MAAPRAPLLAAPLLLLAACAADEPPRFLSTTLHLPTQDAHGPYRVLAEIDDDHTVAGAILYSATSTTSSSTVASAMTRGEGLVWSGELPAAALGSVLYYAVQAEDDGGQRSRSPAEGWLSFTVGNIPSRPEVLTVWPDRGPSSGGTEVLIVGRDLREQLRAELGRPAQTLVVASRTQASVRTAPSPAGTVDVVVVNADGGRGVLPQAFTYFPAPEIERVEPPSGPAAGGTAVRIFGQRFAEGARFLFDGRAATQVVIESPTRARAVTPPGRPGLVTVRVEHPTLGFGERPNAYEYIPAPEVTRVEPDRGPDLGGTAVEIFGRFFQPGAQVLFDGLQATNVRFLGPERLRAQTPAHFPGLVRVDVRNPDAQAGGKDDAYRYVGPPVIDEVSPPYAAIDGGAEVRIRGQNLAVADTLIEMQIGMGLDATAQCRSVSDSELACITPRALEVGPHDVRATSLLDGRFDVESGGITYFDLLSVVPARGPSSGGTRVVVTGTFLPSALSISFGATRAACRPSGPDVWICMTPPGPPNQLVDVGALPPDAGQVPAVLEDGYFYVAPPRIDSIDPDHGPQRGGTQITIRGDFFQPGLMVTIDGLPCADLVFVSAMELTCTVPPHIAGVVPVTVTNPDGQLDTFVGYEYVPITFAPLWGLVDGFVTLTIHGAEMAPNATVRIGGVNATNVRFDSPEQLRVDVPPSLATGSVAVEVRNPGVDPDVSFDQFSYRTYQDRSVASMAGTGETSEVMIHDLDGDGDSDLVFVNGSAALPEDSEVMENVSLSFNPHFLGAVDASNEGNACDFDRDGDLDLVWGSSGGFVHIWRNDGAMSFSSQVPPGQPGDSFEASFHDINGDGLCDLINVGISTEDAVFRNDNGTFRRINNAVPHEGGFIHDHKIDTGDLDGDGDADMVLVVDDVNFVSPEQRNRVYRNNGQGVFTEDLVNATLMREIHGDIYDVRMGDMDGDGDLDIVMPVFNGAPVVLLNDGAGTLSQSASTLPNVSRPESSLVLEDVEGDGDLDLYLVSLEGAVSTPDSSRLFLSDGHGGYHRATRGEPPLPPPGYRAAIGDIDGDRANDVLIGVAFGPNVMYFALE